jgi:serpin B
VHSQTNGLIPSILPPGDYSGMTALIANAIYFKGQWTSSFDPSATVAAPFVLSDGTTVSVNMMAQTATFAYLHGSDFQMVRLPYGNGRMSMLIVLPDAGEALTDFVGRMTADALNASISQMQKQYGAVSLPKFTVTYSNEMVPILKALGMAVAFECPAAGPTAVTADFSALTTNPGPAVQPDPGSPVLVRNSR